MEIERKFLVLELPKNLQDFHFHHIQQGYLATNPVVRIRKQDDEYILTYKGPGLMSREEVNLPLTKEAYEHMLPKTDAHYISKLRYLIPFSHQLTAELDIFENQLHGLKMVEVEFPTEEMALSFQPPTWFGAEVTQIAAFQNSNLRLLSNIEQLTFPEIDIER